MKNLTCLIAFSSMVVAACADGGGDGDDGELDASTAEQAIEASESAEAEGNLMMATIDGSEMADGDTSEQIAVSIGANVAVRWNPSGCATVQRNGLQLSIVYNNCTGPRGLVNVTGQLDLEVSLSLDGAIVVHASSADLMVNGAQLAMDANAEYRLGIAEHTLTVMTHSSGTGPRGNAIEHNGDYMIAWEPAVQCAQIAGEWSTTVDERTRSHEVDLRRCLNQCPVGTIVQRFDADASLTVTFDGTDHASFMASTGATGTVAISCTR
ncbi:MAG: hypothetical protein AB7O24_25660 [Kofleriaceae bacterium]